MHFEDAHPTKVPAGPQDVPWWKDLTRYQWFVFIVASLGWLFDTMDQQLFNLARKPAVTELLTVAPATAAFVGLGRRVRRLRHHDLHDRLGARAGSFSGSSATGSAAPRR